MNEVTETIVQPVRENEVRASMPYSDARTTMSITPQTGGGTCGCGGSGSSSLNGMPS